MTLGTFIKVHLAEFAAFPILRPFTSLLVTFFECNTFCIAMSKRTLDSFFAPPSKKAKIETPLKLIDPPRASYQRTEHSPTSLSTESTSHTSYAWAIPHLPLIISSEVSVLVSARGKPITNQPHLDLLYFQNLIPPSISNDLFKFLRSQLFFHRVSYPIKRSSIETIVNTPRYTTVFGVDSTSLWRDGNLFEKSSSEQPIPQKKYKCTPRPIPECLDLLRRITEAATNTSYNICLVNYYASGADSISYHSDDEHFLEALPAIASFSLGARRDFLMKHKPPSGSKDPFPGASTITLPLSSGDMVLMRGETQPNWLHSIPKRKGGDADKGRINITLRKAMIPAGTENYYRYNVGSGGVYKWDEGRKEMMPWKKES